jgi:YaiO family outer membrane protein
MEQVKMKTQFRILIPALGAALLTAWCAAADQAEPLTTLSATDLVFSSPSNTYGPWTIETLHSTNKTAGGAVDLELSARSDRDRPFAANGVQVGVGYTQDLSSRTFYNVIAKVGSAGFSPLPAYELHGELGFKVSPDRRLVINVADDYAGYTHGITSNTILLGPTFYGDGYVLQARISDTANTGSFTRLGALAALDVYTSRRMSKVSLTGQFGPASYESALPGIPIAGGDYTGAAVTLSTLQWFSKTFGVTAGVHYMHLTNLRTGGLLYNARGITLGLAVK